MKKVILFDLDDTLAPEESFIKSGYRAVSEYLKEHFGTDGNEKNIYSELYALYKESSKLVFNRYLENHMIYPSDDEIKELVRIYREHEPSTEYYEDVPPALKKLKQEGCKLGIITDGYSITQRNKLKALKADTMFDRIIITDELGRDYWKPDERSFIMMKETFSAEYGDMVYVGDNPAKDFYIGKDNRISTIRVLRPGSVYENTPYLEDVRESALINSFDELFSALKRL